MAESASRRGAVTAWATFSLLCVAEIVAFTGAQLTAFGLGVWVYERTGSTTAYSWVVLASLVPRLLVSPLAGMLVDRSLRGTLLAGHAGVALCASLLAILASADSLHLGLLLPIVAVISVCSAVEFPALSAAIPRLVPPERLARANGVLELGRSIGSIAAPAAAAAILLAGGIWTILIVEGLTLILAIAILVAIRLPRADGMAAAERPRPWKAVREGWQYIRARPGFMWLLALFATTNFNLRVAQILVTPLVLGFADVGALGRVMSIGSVGLFVGGMLLVTWGGPRDRVQGVLAFASIEGAAFLLLGLVHSSTALVAVAAFSVMLSSQIQFGCSQVIWQRKVPARIQGSVFGVRFLLADIMMPVALVLAGPLADRVLGVRPSFVLIGALSLAAVALAASSPRLRRLERELDDEGLKACEGAQGRARALESPVGGTP